MPTKRCCCSSSCRLSEDNFDRSDANPPSGNWLEIGGEWEIKDNELNCITAGTLATTVCHPVIYDNGSYVMRCTMVGISDGTQDHWEVGVGNPTSPAYVVECTHNFSTKQAVFNLWTGNKSVILGTQTYSGVTADQDMIVCYAPGLAVDASMGFNPQLEYCDSGTGNACYTSGGVDVGGFSFRDGTWDDWTYDLHWLDLAICEKCPCFCEKSRDDFKCYPDVLYLSFTNIAGGATLATIPLYQSFADSSSYLWPEKVAWFSHVQNCGGPASAQWTARFLCGQENLGSLAFGTASYQFENPSFSQIGFTWDDGGNAYDKRDAIKASSTCDPILLTFPTLRALCAFPSSSCTGGGVDCATTGCETPYCTSLNDQCYDEGSCPDILFTPKVTA